MPPASSSSPAGAMPSSTSTTAGAPATGASTGSASMAAGGSSMSRTVPRRHGGPPQEAERIVDALFERRVPHAYILFPGEDHGFRSRDAIIASFSSELSFYAQVFGFEPADGMDRLDIRFLDEWQAKRDGT